MDSDTGAIKSIRWTANIICSGSESLLQGAAGHLQSTADTLQFLNRENNRQDLRHVFRCPTIVFAVTSPVEGRLALVEGFDTHGRLAHDGCSVTRRRGHCNAGGVSDRTDMTPAH